MAQIWSCSSRTIGGGLANALRFHKLRNFAEALVYAEEREADARQLKRRSVLRDFKSIWQAKHFATALRRYLAVWRKNQTAQLARIIPLTASWLWSFRWPRGVPAPFAF